MDLFWTMPVVAIVGYYLVEYAKIKHGLHNKYNGKTDDGLLVGSRDLHRKLGIKQEEVEAFLKQAPSLYPIKLIGDVYYSLEDLKNAIKTK